MKRNTLLIGALALCVCPALAVAQERVDKRLPAVRATTPIALDGRLERAGVGRRASGQGLHPERSARGRAGDLRHRGPAALRRRRAVHRRVRERRAARRHHHQRAAQGLQHGVGRRLSGRHRHASTTSATATSSPSIPRARSGTRRCRTKAAIRISNWDGIWDVQHAHRRRRLVRRDSHSVPDAEVQRGRAADLGHQLSAAPAAVERKQLLVAAAAHSPAVAGLDGRHARGSSRRCGPGSNLRVKPYALASSSQLARPATTATSMRAST